MWLGPGVNDTTTKWSARTPAGIAVTCQATGVVSGDVTTDRTGLALHLEYARLRLLRGFEDLLGLKGLHGVEHFPHQIETVRKVLRHFRGRVLLADEVGLGKTIEACLVLREYRLRGLIRRALILVPAPLVGQWREELLTKFDLEFSIPSSSAGPEYWERHDWVLTSLSRAKSKRHFAAVQACPWDMVIVDEAHHCRNRETRNWQLVNALKRRHLLLLTATPVQNDLVELHNLLTLLEPGHLKTEGEFKRTYVRRGNPRDPRNRERLRSLLGEVMIRNTRSLVSVNLPARYVQTFTVTPGADEAQVYRMLESYLHWQLRAMDSAGPARHGNVEPPDDEVGTALLPFPTRQSDEPAAQERGPWPEDPEDDNVVIDGSSSLTRMQIHSLLIAAGSHPAALAAPVARLANTDDRAGAILDLIRRVNRSAKEDKLLELLARNSQDKTLVFARCRATLDRLAEVLSDGGIGFSLFRGDLSQESKARAVEQFRTERPVMLCSESGGEGHNLQFANTMINFDLPWNPMRIEQRIGRIHRIGQTREVFVFNLCTAGSVEQRILRVLHDKIRMFELVVGEIGSILGNLEGGEEFESLILDLWLRSRGEAELEAAFERLGESLIEAQREYLQAKELDDALFGEDYE